MTTKITEKNISSLANAGVSWQSVVVADGSTGFTAVAGRGYFINTTSGTITVTFPASPTAGDTIVIVDYASTFATNNVTISFNGNKLEADTGNATLSTNDQTHTFVFTDATQGWKIVNQDTATGIQPLFISATGGTITTSGDFKIHTFTGDGCFVVSSLGNPTGGGSTVDFLVVAGGGSGGTRVCGNQQGGGGAGGFRFSAVNVPVSGSPAAPLAAPSGITVTTTTFPITVGGGGAAIPATPTGTRGNQGSNSVFSTITSTGGGSGGAGTGNGSPVIAGGSGGSGGGSGGGGPNGLPAPAGNSPPVSPSQGNPGGLVQPGNSPDGFASGSGGAGAAGTVGSSSNASNAGIGAGLPSNFGTTGQPSGGYYYYSGGGGAGGLGPLGGRPGGTGGGGPGSDHPSNPPAAAVSGTANTGGGGGGGGSGGGHPFASGAGGSGIVVITYKFQ